MAQKTSEHESQSREFWSRLIESEMAGAARYARKLKAMRLKPDPVIDPDSPAFGDILAQRKETITTRPALSPPLDFS